MIQIPGRMIRGIHVRSDISYAVFGKATWKWWCKQNGIHFVVIDKPIGGQAFYDMPPTLQRWLAPQLIFKEFGYDSQIAMVDADTMIRWDAPSLFDVAGPTFAAVQGSNASWIYRSVRAYQHLFPEVVLPWWDYFNAGVVVLGTRQLSTINAFVDFSLERKSELHNVQVSGNFGSDQTPLNFFLRRAGEQVCLLPRPFNVLNCFPTDPMIFALEMNPTPDSGGFAERVLARDGMFDFVEFGYIWHFATIYASRCMIMNETWRRVRGNYPGADLEE
jgi:hypothetical protein